MVEESGRVVGGSFSSEQPVYISKTEWKGALKVGEI